MRPGATGITWLSCWLVLAASLAGQSVPEDNHWPQFRGHRALGLGAGSPPTRWNVDSGENIAWKTALAGLAHSSPVVWGNRVFVTTAVNPKIAEPELGTGWLGGTGEGADDEGQWSWQLICVDLTTGETLWQEAAVTGIPAIQRHLKASHANCSPATNGELVLAFFGSEGLYCYDMEGRLQWGTNFGRLHSGPYNAPELEWGFASSPVIFEDKVIVQCDCLNTGFVAVLDLKTGNELLRIERDDVATWSTPAIVVHEGKPQVVCNGYRQMAGYDLRSGEMLWTLSGGGDVPVPTPLFANGLVYLTNGHGRSPTYAISPGATGDLSPDKESDELPEGLVWWQQRDGSYMPTPIVVGQRLYTCNDNGRLTVRDALTGEEIYKQRVGEGTGTYSASAVAAADHLYFAREDGVVHVVRTGDEYELAAANAMKETVMATPAIAGDRLLIRTVKHLFCIAPMD